MAFHAVVKKIEEAMERRNPDIASSVLLYFDDALLTGATFEELQEKLEILYQALEDVGMNIQPRRYNMGLPSVKWLDHQITEHGFFPDQDPVCVLLDWPEPKNRTEASKFHGLISTFWKFIRNFASRTIHIRGLLKRNPGSTGKEAVEWTNECRKELKDITDALIASPMVGHPHFAAEDAPFIVTVDMSRNGVGCMLSQEQFVPSVENPEKKIKQEVILYLGSRKCTD